MKYCILGNPIPLARPRISKMARDKKRMYDPQQAQKLIMGITLKNQHDDKPLFSGAIHFTIFFFMPIPASISKKKREALPTKPHIIKPDLSNMIKFVEDVASGILYSDDCIIASITAHKLYDDNPRTELIISKKEENE